MVSTSFQRVEMPSTVRTEQGYLEQAPKKSWEGLASISYLGRDFSIASSYCRTVDSLIAEEETKNVLLAYVSGASYVDCTIKSKTSDIEKNLGKIQDRENGDQDRSNGFREVAHSLFINVFWKNVTGYCQHAQNPVVVLVVEIH